MTARMTNETELLLFLKMCLQISCTTARIIGQQTIYKRLIIRPGYIRDKTENTVDLRYQYNPNVSLSDIFITRKMFNPIYLLFSCKFVLTIYSKLIGNIVFRWFE